ncbi:DUF6233 domain-containing protein [Streptomyces avermitilis]|uniref:DUF6233 domain-containing protein n=1 Tax=Streptomyces avermitilis TaxID=33903 RepID=UPI00371D83CC
MQQKRTPHGPEPAVIHLADCTMIEGTPHCIRADEARAAFTERTSSRAVSAGPTPSWASTWHGHPGSTSCSAGQPDVDSDAWRRRHSASTLQLIAPPPRCCWGAPPTRSASVRAARG